MIDLNGKTALITGAGRGIGRAIALELSRLGTHVALIARSTTELDAVAAEIQRGGGTATVISANLSETPALEALLDQVRAQIGNPDILINNAAMVAPLGATSSLDLGEIQGALALNVVAPVVLSARMIPAMIEKGWGAIINISSGIVAHPAGMIGGNVYAVSKSALESHTINLAAELADTGITVNAYRPGTVDTQMQEWIRAQDPDQIGHQLHDRFTSSYADGALTTPARSAHALIRRLGGTATGQIWDASDPE